jgi:hypothetical protein
MAREFTQSHRPHLFLPIAVRYEAANDAWGGSREKVIVDLNGSL